MKKNGKKSKEIEELEQFWEGIPKEARDELLRLADAADSEEEFVRTIFVGDCPRCDSDKTAISGSAGEEEDLSVGLCKACGYLWCFECECELEPGAQCGHWDICESCEELDEETGLCPTSADECSVIQAWLGTKTQA
jgi:hypothetical protein